MEFVGEGDDLGELVWEEDEGTGVDGVGLGMALEGECGDDAEVVTGASDGPEEVGVLGWGGDDLVA